MSVNVDSSFWNLRTAGGIPYKLISTTGDFSDESAIVTEIYIIRAITLLRFLTESFPPPEIENETTFYPDKRAYAGLPNLTTRRIRFEPLTGSKPVDPFLIHLQDLGVDFSKTFDENIKVTIEYSTTPLQNEDGILLEISSNTSGTFLHSPIRDNYKWQDTGGPVEAREIDTSFAITEPLTEWTVKWRQIPRDFFEKTLLPRLRDLIGKVNESIMPIFYDAPVETILFLGWNLREQFTWRVDVRTPFELELKFLEKNFEYFDTGGEVTVNHNLFFRPGQGYQRLTFGTDDKPAHLLGDLNKIFDPQDPPAPEPEP